MWELLAPGYRLLYEHVDMIGGVTRWGGLSGLKCWNSDNLFDWIDFFKINTYFYFFDERQNVKQKPRIFWKHGVVPFDACSFQLIRSRSVRGACGKKREDEFWSLLFYLLTSFFSLNFIRETLLCSLNLFSCAQPILIAWTSCLKLIISKIYLLWLLLPKQPLWMKKYISLQ